MLIWPLTFTYGTVSDVPCLWCERLGEIEIDLSPMFETEPLFAVCPDHLITIEHYVKPF